MRTRSKSPACARSRSCGLNGRPSSRKRSSWISASEVQRAAIRQSGGSPPVPVSPLRDTGGARRAVAPLSFALFSEAEDDDGGADAGAAAEAGGADNDENAAPPGVRRDATETARLQAQLRRIAAGGAEPLSPIAAEALPGGVTGTVELHDREYALAGPERFAPRAPVPRMTAQQERAADFAF